MPQDAASRPTDWLTYYEILRDKLGVDKLRRIKTRLYEKLENINGELDELEEDKELHFQPGYPEFAAFIDQQVESLLTAGREVSIQLETVIGLLESGSIVTNLT
jgi:hypothetical protein